MKASCEKHLGEQFGGDVELMCEIYDEYVRSVAEKREELKEARAASDWTLVDRVAHTLKGNALAAGDQEMADAAIAVRKASALCDAAGAASRVEKMGELSNEL